jgi:hypothetical protein
MFGNILKNVKDTYGLKHKATYEEILTGILADKRIPNLYPNRPATEMSESFQYLQLFEPALEEMHEHAQREAKDRAFKDVLSQS